MIRAALTILLFLVVPACSSTPPPSDPSNVRAPDQQRIVDRAAAAFRSMRDDPKYRARLEHYLSEARAVVIFPRLIKASLLFGGKGGNGVMVVRRGDGSFSPPAFYSIGAASAGFQVGYQEASVVFLLMRDRVVRAAMESDFRLGGDASVAAGDVGEGGSGVTGVASSDIYAFMEVGGAYVGASFEGLVMGPRKKHNEAYYGATVTPRQILVEGTVDQPGTAVLSEALAPRPASPAPAPTGSGAAEPSNSGSDSGATAPVPTGTPTAPSTGASPKGAYSACSPESRQAEACAEIFEPVCAEIDTGTRCVTAPCPESREHKTFPNACSACREAKTLGYRPGACPGD